MKITSVVVTILLFAGCGMNKREKVVEMLANPANMLMQSREVNRHKFLLSYLPAGVRTAGDMPEWCFKLNIRLPEGVIGQQEGTQASFGVDTLFYLVSGKDTLLPLHAMRIANGNMKGIEYMIVFSRPADPEGSNTRFCFSDWLFTHQYLEFPLRIPAIIKIDSLSSRI